ncbi:MAG: CARDB domain-containing protein [Candidatus Binatia bacterium]
MPSLQPTKTIALAIASLLGGALWASVAAAQPGLYWTDTHFNTISDSNLDGSGKATLVSSVSTSFGLALDGPSGIMCWTDLGKVKTIADRGDETVRCANLDGSGTKVILTAADGLLHPVDLEIDPAAGKVYWSDAGSGGRISRANLDGSNVELVIDTAALRAPNYGQGPGLTLEFTQIWGIALDVEGGALYWTDYFNNDIHRANLDGSNVTRILSGLEVPRGIDLDVAAGKVYWTEGFGDKIMRANLDGSGSELLVSKATGTRLKRPFGIALDRNAGFVYWTERDSGLIRRADLDGSNVAAIHVLQYRRKGGAFRPSSPSALALIPSNATPPAPSPAPTPAPGPAPPAGCQINNGGCDALVTCTDTPNGPNCGRCPMGYTGSGDSVCIPVAPTVSDLSAAVTQIKARPKKGNTQIEFQFIVANAGPNTINTTFTVTAFLSQDTVADELDTPFESWDLGGLGSGGLITLKSKGEVSGLVSGQYIVIQADVGATIAESDETNNSAYRQVP